MSLAVQDWEELLLWGRQRLDWRSTMVALCLGWGRDSPQEAKEEAKLALRVLAGQVSVSLAHRANSLNVRELGMPLKRFQQGPC